LEPWEKVLVNGEEFTQTDHGEIACTDCHLGEQNADKELAHTGLISRPSEDPDSACGECHDSQVETQANSLHATQEGYWTILEARGASAEDEEMQEMFGNHCASCHTSCGDCHVSQPATVGGGLLDGHNFTDSPPLSRTCTACHGSRIGNEFLGKHEGLKADVHFRQGRMACTECHTGTEMHGTEVVVSEEEAAPPHRYEGDEGPRCQDCHQIENDGVNMHGMHGDALSCQVCHSISYTSCDSCHVAISEESGNPFFETAGAYLTFLIGKNPRQSEERPYEYVPLRHVPVDRDSFSFYGDNLLPDFDAQPTWRYTTPHNIQRETPQTETCNACHGNSDLFLTADKVAAEELEANVNVIVDSIPEAR
jgi:thiosulfate/3-mercaptopyruvate sulfurtransferase